jgi:hypothetical protein
MPTLIVCMALRAPAIHSVRSWSICEGLILGGCRETQVVRADPFDTSTRYVPIAAFNIAKKLSSITPTSRHQERGAREQAIGLRDRRVPPCLRFDLQACTPISIVPRLQHCGCELIRFFERSSCLWLLSCTGWNTHLLKERRCNKPQIATARRI